MFTFDDPARAASHSNHRRPVEGGVPQGRGVAQLLALQRAAGNAATATLVSDHNHRDQGERDRQEQDRAEPADVPSGSPFGPATQVTTETYDFHATILKPPREPGVKPATGSTPNPAVGNAGHSTVESDGRTGGGDATIPLDQIGGGDAAAPAVSGIAGALAGGVAGIAGAVAGGLAGLMGSQPGPAKANEPGEEPFQPRTVSLPDVVYPFLAKIPELDKPLTGPSLTYAPTVTQAAGSPGPDEFGATSPYDFRMTGTSVTETATAFTVTSTVTNPITFQIAAPTGPGGEKDIPSDSAPIIKQSNYTRVADALKPDMSDLGGRPPRSGFYAVDLTTRHERFHATDGQTSSTSGVALSQTWLGTQRANDVAGVEALIRAIPARVIAVRQAAMTFPGREERAYADGAPSYKTRSDAIRAKGVAGSYPA